MRGDHLPFNFHAILNINFLSIAYVKEKKVRLQEIESSVNSKLTS
jgi:hypothetical protein